jgi:hypothetical protein
MSVGIVLALLGSGALGASIVLFVVWHKAKSIGRGEAYGAYTKKVMRAVEDARAEDAQYDSNMRVRRQHISNLFLRSTRRP